MSAAGTMTWDWARPAGRREAPVQRIAAGSRPGYQSVVSASLETVSVPPVTTPVPVAKSGPAARPGEEKRVEAEGQALVKRCLHGDALAWVELVRTHHGRVYGLCYRFTGSSHDAEDLTQEVFLKVWGNLRSFDGARGSFHTWLTTMTRNLLVDHFRRTKGQRATDSMDAGWDDGDERPNATALSLEDKGRSPHQHAMQRELEAMVQQALTKVSPELREAVILRDLQDMDYKEIAEVLRVPEGTVKSRISRGRAELARLLESKRTQVS